MNDVTVRPFHEADIEAVSTVEQLAFTTPQSIEQLKALALDKAHCLVAEQNSRLVGFAFTRVIADEAELLNIGVLPEWQGLGVANAVLDQLIDLLKEKSICSLFLEVRKSNQRAIACYQRKGFATTGHRKNYYATADGGREDALLMQLAL